MLLENNVDGGDKDGLNGNPNEQMGHEQSVNIFGSSSLLCVVDVHDDGIIKYSNHNFLISFN